MHIYDCTNKYQPQLTDKTRWSDIKEPNLYPSVTTILKYLPNDFLNDIWKPKKLLEIFKDNPDITPQEAVSKSWGELKDVETNEIIPSSEFGTRGHKALEELSKHNIDENYQIKSSRAWLDFVQPAFDMLLSVIDPLCVERSYCYDNLSSRFCGTVDVLGEKDEGLALVDYKFRKNNNVYDSDKCQLAIESFMVKEYLSLNYVPKIYSIIIDTKGNPFLHSYTEEDCAWYAKLFLLTADMVCHHKKINE
tara:strand:- start:21 stop:767 length:747 start_codon:yes stop_codon:yes gene_type:complete